MGSELFWHYNEGALVKITLFFTISRNRQTTVDLTGIKTSTSMQLFFIKKKMRLTAAVDNLFSMKNVELNA